MPEWAGGGKEWVRQVLRGWWTNHFPASTILSLALDRERESWKQDCRAHPCELDSGRTRQIYTIRHQDRGHDHVRRHDQVVDLGRKPTHHAAQPHSSADRVTISERQRHFELGVATGRDAGIDELHSDVGVIEGRGATNDGHPGSGRCRRARALTVVLGSGCHRKVVQRAFSVHVSPWWLGLVYIGE